MKASTAKGSFAPFCSFLWEKVLKKMPSDFPARGPQAVWRQSAWEEDNAY